MYVCVMSQIYVLKVCEKKYEGCSKSNAFCFMLQAKTSEADIGGMSVEAEPAQQYSIPCCCCVTGGSRGDSDTMGPEGSRFWKPVVYSGCVE